MELLEEKYQPSLVVFITGREGIFIIDGSVTITKLNRTEQNRDHPNTEP